VKERVDPIFISTALRVTMPATLPPALWKQVWDGLDKGFKPDGHHPEIHMEGACKCGKLKFRVDGTLAAAFWCHCHMCRKYWSQTTPTETCWVHPANALTITEGQEHVKTWTVEELSRNLRGQGTVTFCGSCGTNINVNFSDPNAIFTLMWPYNFNYAEWGDLAGRGDKARHGDIDMFRPRFHAHYENRAVDMDDGLPKLADIWLEGMPLMNATGEIVGKVSYPMKGFENGFLSAPCAKGRPPPPVSAASSSIGVSPTSSAHRAVLVSKKGKEVTREIVHFTDFAQLPYQDGSCDVVVKVSYSNLNYKDGIVLTGAPGVARKFPLVPGIDFAGKVVESKSPLFKPGQSVVLTGHYNGQHMDGGYADMVRTKSEWLIPLPEFVSEKESMIIGTAGFTAMMCIMNLEKHGSLKRGEKKPVLVTGASGGVGSFALKILNHLGYQVVASVMGKEKFEAHCKKMGAHEVIDILQPGKPLGKEKYAGAVDPVGGQTLATALSEVMYGRAVSCCGLAGSSELKTTVMPFILRGVKLLGIDSVQAPMDARREVWEEFGRIQLPKAFFEEVSSMHSLEDAVTHLGPDIMAGKVQGRAVIDMAKAPSKL